MALLAVGETQSAVDLPLGLLWGASVAQPSVTTVAVNEAQVNDAVNDGTLYRFSHRVHAF